MPDGIDRGQLSGGLRLPLDGEAEPLSLEGHRPEGEQCGGNDDDKRILGNPVERFTAAQSHIHLVGQTIGGGFQQPQPQYRIYHTRCDHGNHQDPLEDIALALVPDKVGGHDGKEQIQHHSQEDGDAHIFYCIPGDDGGIGIQKDLAEVIDAVELPDKGGIQTGKRHNDGQDRRQDIQDCNKDQER